MPCNTREIAVHRIKGPVEDVKHGKKAPFHKTNYLSAPQHDTYPFPSSRSYRKVGHKSKNAGSSLKQKSWKSTWIVACHPHSPDNRIPSEKIALGIVGVGG